VFLPPLPLLEVKRALLLATLPEFRFFSTKIQGIKSFKWLNLEIKLTPHEGLLAGPLFSSPFLALFLEVFRERGLKEVLFLGWGGLLEEKDLKIGELFIPEKALSLEGTGSLYFPKKRVFTPDKGFLNRIKKILKERGISFKTGNILSLDAPYLVEKYPERFKIYLKKVQAIDMETSALYALSQHYSLKALSLILLTDKVGETTTQRPEEKLKKLRENLLPVFRNFLENGL